MAAIATILKSAKGRYVTLNHVKRINSKITNGVRQIPMSQDWGHKTSGTMMGVEGDYVIIIGPKGGAKKVPLKKVTAVTIELED